MLIAVTDHAAERFRQRVRGSLDEKTEIVEPGCAGPCRRTGGPGPAVLVRDLERRDLVSSAVPRVTSWS